MGFIGSGDKTRGKKMRSLLSICLVSLLYFLIYPHQFGVGLVLPYVIIVWHSSRFGLE